MTEQVWVRNALRVIETEDEAVMWIVMEHACVYFKADGTTGVIQGRPGQVLPNGLSQLFERLM